MASTSIAPTQNSFSTTQSLSDSEKLLLQAKSVEKSAPHESIELYRQVIFEQSVEPKYKEQAILSLTALLNNPEDIESLVKILTKKDGVFSEMPRPRPAHIIKRLFDEVLDKMSDGLDVRIRLCKSLLIWCDEDKRSVFKRSLQVRLAELLFQAKEYAQALEILHSLSRELARIEDKLGLLDVQLLEGRIWYAMKNIPKAKAAFTAARTTGNSICSPPLTQAALDIQSGKLYVEEREYGIAYAHFIEALDGYTTEKHPQGSFLALSYMLLAKIMSDALISDIEDLLKSNKAAIPLANEPTIKCLVEVGRAYASRSLVQYNNILTTAPLLKEDSFIFEHLQSQYDKLLQGNLLKLISPYSSVTLQCLSEKIGLSPILVESKLCQMILDRVLYGVIDQEQSILIVLEEPKPDLTYLAAMQTIKSLSKVVDGLYEKANRLQ